MTVNFMVPYVPRENYVIPPDTDPYAGACNANARENHYPCVAEVQREEISREVVSCFRTSGHAIVFRLITIAILQNQTS